MATNFFALKIAKMINNSKTKHEKIIKIEYN